MSGDHPVVLRRIDGHSMWVNSAVLSLAGISRSTPDPPGGRVYRNAENDPTGMLVDRAMDAVGRVTPEPAPSERERRIRAALRQYARWGLTSVHDAGVDLESIAIYKDLLARGELPVRIYAMAQGTGATLERCLVQGPEVDLGEGRLSIRSFKIFLDGALGSRGAELADPYSDAPASADWVKDTTGSWTSSCERLVARDSRWPPTPAEISRCGGRWMVTNAAEHGPDRFRIEHASVIRPMPPRFASLGVIASMQPVFVGEYSPWADDRLGPLRVGWVLPMRELLAAGASWLGRTIPRPTRGTHRDAVLHVTRRARTGRAPRAGATSRDDGRRCAALDDAGTGPLRPSRRTISDRSPSGASRTSPWSRRIRTSCPRSVADADGPNDRRGRERNVRSRQADLGARY